MPDVVADLTTPKPQSVAEHVRLASHLVWTEGPTGRPKHVASGFGQGQFRFLGGQHVQVNMGKDGWQAGIIFSVCIDDNGQRMPYRVRLLGTDDFVVAPRDHDVCIVKGGPCFQVGDNYMANYRSGCQPGTVAEVM